MSTKAGIVAKSGAKNFFKNMASTNQSSCKNLLQKIKPVDIVAIIVVIGGLALKFKGADGLVGTLLTAIVFYYFGKQGRANLP